MEELLKMAGDEKIEFEEEQYNRSAVDYASDQGAYRTGSL